MKKALNWKSAEIVNIYDEAPLWSAPFGQLLLENIPMRRNAVVVDLGFGTGFPLLELAQRFGAESTLYGVDIWEQAIERTKEKIRQLDISNVQILECPAHEVDLKSESVDLVCSNVGINNFDNTNLVYTKVNSILKPEGDFCFTTNDNRTFHELYSIFNETADELNLGKDTFKENIEARGTSNHIVQEVTACGFKLINQIEEQTSFRFTDADAVFDHGLMRIGFLPTWRQIIGEDSFNPFMDQIKRKINKVIDDRGEFKLTAPILYFHFRKR